MFKYSFQSGFLSLLYSVGSDPLQLWFEKVEKGKIVRVKDSDIQSPVIDLVSRNISSTYIHCPCDMNESLGIKMPILTIVMKNMNKYFSFEIKVLGEKNEIKYFRASNFQCKTRKTHCICTLPLLLQSGWNTLTMDISDLLKRVYSLNYVETISIQVHCLSVKIHANCRLRRVYFSDRIYSDEELTPEFKLYFPSHKTEEQTK